MEFERINESIPPFDEAAAQRAVDQWNGVAKPIGSLGLLEQAIVQIAGITGSHQVSLRHRVAVPMCADNGVVAEGVTQTGQEVTAIVASNMARGTSSVCKMGALAEVRVVPVDVGMAYDAVGVIDRRIARATANMAQGPAMTREQASAAVQVGIDVVGELVGQGCDILVTGEMGIGNTTTSSAVAAVLLERPVEEMTGRGAGLTDEGLRRKVAAIKQAIAVNEPRREDALDVLSKVGGFDIAAMAGVFIGGALHRVPVLVDGFISAVAALVAVRLCPACRHAIIATHVSAEPAGRMLLDELRLKPFICAEMRLGEGTGAVCALPMLDMALAVYGGSSFADIGIEAYEVEPA